MPKSRKWVPAESIDPKIFQVPIKKGKAIAIKQSPIDSNGPLTNHLEADATQYKPLCPITNRNDKPLVPSQLNNKEVKAIQPTQGRSRSHLDIYAHKYVPYWLKAINECFVVTNHAPQIQRQDYDAYRSTYIGSHFKKQLPRSKLPPAVVTELDTRLLSDQTYRVYWHQRLQNEYAAQAFQNYSLTLFEIDVHPAELVDPSHNVYRFKVPGLRENIPRIDLGDIILIRPFMPHPAGDIADQAHYWSLHREGLAPQSLGIEHHAVVWSLVRRDEALLVRLGKPMVQGTKCNVIIPLQIQKSLPAYRAIDMIGPVVSTTQGSWLASMLFPTHGVLQKSLSKGAFSLEWFDADLNFEQKRAVQAVLDAEYGTVPYLVSGPPGTGKTKTMVETVLQLIRNKGKAAPHILVCAPSDSAADTLLVRLAQHLSQQELFRLNNWSRLATEVPGEVRPYCYLDVNQLHALPAFEFVMSFKVVVTTCRDSNVLLQGGLTNAELASTTIRMLQAVAPAAVELINPIHWTALIIDEAAQATEPEALIPISVVAPFEDMNSLLQVQYPQIIMAGDEFQLGPRLVSKAVSGQLGDFDTTGLEKSLFQRVFERPLYAHHPLSRSHGLRPLTREMLPILRPPFANLIRNYRSHPAILSTPSALFYSDTLIPERPEASSTIMSWPSWPGRKQNVWPVMFHQNTGPDSVESVLEGDGAGSGNLMNYNEAIIARDLILSLLAHVNGPVPSGASPDYLRQEDIIVLSPFTAQVNHLRKVFREAGRYDVRIGPLEAFQGLEARVVVICTTRTRLGQHPHSPAKFVNEDKARNLGVIDEPKGFNVAVTRAQEALIVIGNAETLSVTRDPCWMSFLRFSVRNDLCLGGKVAWFGKSTGRNDLTLGMGKLERALLYAESLQELAPQDDSSLNISGSTQQSLSGRGEIQSFKFALRGTMIDLDERMWEMQIGDEESNMIRYEEDKDDEIYDGDEEEGDPEDKEDEDETEEITEAEA